MTQILFPTDGETVRSLAFYLAAEEYAAGLDGIGESMFFWTVQPSVIFGRNQCMEAEVNLSWCRAHRVQVFRRRSGGGCVYADRGNLMISYISPGLDARDAFCRYLSMMTDALRRLGVDAEPSGRNDILAGGRKISGNAFYTAAGKSIVHGTLLYDVDMEAMQAAITPSRDKLDRHGVASVRQRVTNMKTLPGMACGVRDTASLAVRLAERLCDSSLMLAPDQVEEISLLAGKYLDPVFVGGKADGH